MAQRERSELAAGIFAIVALAACLGVVFWLGTAGLFKKAKPKTYLLYPESAGNAGLTIGTQVFLGGNAIGAVSDIVYVKDVQVWQRPAAGASQPATDAAAQAPGMVNGTMYVVDLNWPHLKLYRNGQAEVPFALVGSPTLVIKNPGTPADKGGRAVPAVSEQAPLLIAPGALAEMTATITELKNTVTELRIQLSPSEKDSLLAKVLQMADYLRDQVDPARAGSVMNNFVAISGSIRHETDVQAKDSALYSVNQAAQNIRKETDVSVKDSTFAKVNHAAGELDAILADARPKVADALTSVGSTAKTLEGYTKQELKNLLDELAKAAGQLDGILANFKTLSATASETLAMNRHAIDETIADLGGMAANLNAAAKEIRRNPWRLLEKPSEKEIEKQNLYDSARAFVEGTSRLNDALARLKAYEELHPGAAAQDPEMAKIQNALKESFEKFKTVGNAFWKEAGKN